MSELVEVEWRDFSPLTEPNREPVEILIAIFAPSFPVTIPKTMPEHIRKGCMAFSEPTLQKVKQKVRHLVVGRFQGP